MSYINCFSCRATFSYNKNKHIHGIKLPKKLDNKYSNDQLTIPKNLIDLSDQGQTGLVLLKIIEIIGEDQIIDMGSETLYFITTILNGLNRCTGSFIKEDPLMIGYDEEELYNSDELIQSFSLDRVNKSGAIFDVQKLKAFNNHYIKNYKFDKLKNMIYPFIPKEWDISEQMVDLVKDKAFTLH